MSKKRGSELRTYTKLRREFLAEDENTYCPVMWMLHGRQVPTVDIHHKAGREGKLLNDRRHWLAVSRAGHDFIHANPSVSRENGWLI